MVGDAGQHRSSRCDAAAIINGMLQLLRLAANRLFELKCKRHLHPYPTINLMSSGIREPGTLAAEAIDISQRRPC